MDRPQLLAYLDHNVLDAMVKGDPNGIGEFLKKAKLVPVFSNETLREIRRSTGYEETFLELLGKIQARYLVPILDAQFRQTGNAEVRVVSPHEAYSSYLENVTPLPDLGFGFTGMLQKMYGGRQDQSFEEIFSGGAEELGELLSKLCGQLKNVQEDDEQIGLAPMNGGESFSNVMKEQYRNIVTQLDAQTGVHVRQFEGATGLGPKVLKNIQGPDIVRKVWELVEATFTGAEADMEVFFGIKPFPFEDSVSREKTILEKVNGIYHQLNFLGYYRDSKMSKLQRFNASFSDMTHAGLATFCHVLICQDKDLVMKAAAAYEYLGLDTKILYFKTRNASA